MEVHEDNKKGTVYCKIRNVRFRLTLRYMASGFLESPISSPFTPIATAYTGSYANSITLKTSIP